MALMKVSKSPDSAIWLHCIQQWFPRLHTETYFVPPVHFNRVPYDTQTLAGHALLVAHEAEGGAGQSSQAPPRQASKKRPSQTPNLNQSSTNNPSQLFHQVFPQTYSSPSSSFKPTHVEDKDVRDDAAQRRVLHGLRALADKLGEVMVVISQLQFGNYLNKPTYAAAASLLPKPVNMAPKYRQGDFDILVIHSQFGLVAGEIKSVGDNFAQLKMTQQEEDAIVAQAVEKAVKQLAKSWQVLRFLVHDQPGVNISKALLLPNVSSSQLLRAINGHPQTMQV